MDVAFGFLYNKLRTPGDRVAFLRDCIGIQRKKFAEKHNFAESTLKCLEKSVFNITPYQCERLLKAFEEENIHCTEEWILSGQGSFPVFTQDVIDKANVDVLYQQYNTATKNIDFALIEANLFKKHYENSLVLRADKNTAMEPYFNEKDYLGGVKLTLPIDSIHYHHPCIINLEEGKQLTKILYSGLNKNTYTFVSPNIFPKDKDSLLINVKVESVYRIIWHRQNLSIAY